MYAPLVIGIAHEAADSRRDLESLWDSVTQLLIRGSKTSPGATIAIELTPSRIAKFQKDGTFQTEPIFNVIKVRAEQLGFKVILIDSEVYYRQSLDLEQKIKELKGRQPLSYAESQRLEDLEQDFAEVVSVKRNRFMLHKVKKLKPEIVIVGQMHAEHIKEMLGLRERNFLSITNIRPPEAFFEEAKRRKVLEQNVRQKRVERLKRRTGW